MVSATISWQDSLFFKDTAPAVLDRIGGFVQERTFEPNHTIFMEGDTASDLYLLKSGRVELIYALPTRPDTTVRITHVEPGEVFAWSALTGGRELTASAVALETSDVFLVPARDLRNVMDSVPNFGYQIMNRLAHLVASRLVDTRRQLQWLQSV